jgi:hypothetical protein
MRDADWSAGTLSSRDRFPASKPGSKEKVKRTKYEDKAKNLLGARASTSSFFAFLLLPYFTALPIRDLPAVFSSPRPPYDNTCSYLSS